MYRKILWISAVCFIGAAFTTTASARLINYDRVAKRRQRAAGIVVVRGVIQDVDYRNNQVTVRDANTLKDHQFILNESMMTSVSEGKSVDVSFTQGSNIAQSVSLVKE